MGISLIFQSRSYVLQQNRYDSVRHPPRNIKTQFEKGSNGPNGYHHNWIAIMASCPRRDRGKAVVDPMNATFEAKL